MLYIDEQVPFKRVYVGGTSETFTGTQVDLCREAIRLSQLDGFNISTNNPLFLEALEVLCGEDNIDVYLVNENGELCVISFFEAYEFLGGDLYREINSIRFQKELNDDAYDDYHIDKLRENFSNGLMKYDKKWDELHKEYQLNGL